jgi:hypothetical protein
MSGPNEPKFDPLSFNAQHATVMAELRTIKDMLTSCQQHHCQKMTGLDGRVQKLENDRNRLSGFVLGIGAASGAIGGWLAKLFGERK